MKATLTCLLCLLLMLTVIRCKDSTAEDKDLMMLINGVRQEVRQRPTATDDLQRRVFLLNRWARILFEQGLDVNTVYPWQRALDIDRATTANPQQAMAEVTAAYADLERFVATHKEDPAENKRILDEINNTRRQLKTTPTNAANLRHRLYCLNQWARLLMAQGIDAGRIYTFETSMMLQSHALLQPEQASVLVDGLFASLESIQATPVITAPSPPPAAVMPPPPTPPQPVYSKSPRATVTVNLRLNASYAQVTEGVAQYDSGIAMTNTSADFKTTRVESPPLVPSTKGGGYMQVTDGAISVELSAVPVFVEPGGGQRCTATARYSPFGMLAGDFDSPGKAVGERYAGNLATKLPFKQIRFIGPNGLHFVLYKYGSDGAGGGARYLDRMKPLYDDAISKGLNVMLTIDPSTAMVAPGVFNKRGEFAQEDVQQYVEFLKAVMRKYPKIKDYSLDTEADASWQPETYARALEITYKTLKGQCPKCRLTTSGMFKNDLQFYEQVLETLKRMKVRKAFDFFGMWHPYGAMDDLRANEYEQIRKNYKDTTELLMRYGYINVPVFIGETGYPSDSHDPRLSAGFHSERRQAQELIKRFVTAIGIGVKRVYWATTVDYHKFGGIEGYFDYTGVIHNPDNKQLSHKKLAYYSYKSLIEKLSCFENAKVTQIDNLPPEVVGYKFERGTKAIYVLWADDALGQ
ncbi:MAG: hypothetical protein HQL05_15295 [Nitrospirae bacterium]|uniref:hypothetical protein n=1 Tax=Candidatus Magnetobacterium casense TaxID=1455061 RepID=UPI00058F873C|nr:hypothetical protein [Candidatus Magnetobacterium casensis]MBF0339184.1 hypothetical protein [Nitrospirota bacterium]